MRTAYGLSPTFSRHGFHLLEHSQPIKANGLGHSEELDDIKTALAAFDARHPSLLLTHGARERLLPDAASFALFDQEFDQPFMAFGTYGLHSAEKYRMPSQYTK